MRIPPFYLEGEHYVSLTEGAKAAGVGKSSLSSWIREGTASIRVIRTKTGMIHAVHEGDCIALANKQQSGQLIERPNPVPEPMMSVEERKFIEIEKLKETGWKEAVYGMGLSFGLTSGKTLDEVLGNEDLRDRLAGVANKLAPKDGGHNKFLRCIQLWLKIRAPRFWWVQFDTYKVGTTALSESTMHTIMTHPFTPEDFDGVITPSIMHDLEALRQSGDFNAVICNLPQSYMQTRLVNLNYAVLREIIRQRMNHKLEHWQMFCNRILDVVDRPEYLPFGDK